MGKEHRTRVIIDRHHVATVNGELCVAFQQKYNIHSYSAWLKNLIYEKFGYHLGDPELPPLIDGMLKSEYYRSLGEWVDDVMRQAMKE